MKFKKHFDDIAFEEEFTSQYNRYHHYDKHIVNNREYDMTEEEYEQYAEDLMKKQCDYKKIFGYKVLDKETGKIGYAKYDKEKEFFTVYNEQGKTVTAFRRPYRDYMGKMFDPTQRYEYIDEIPKGK